MPPIQPISIQDIELLPLISQAVIAEQHLDLMGHMNVRHYLALFDDASWTFFQSLGMTEAYYKANDAGGFALEHHIRYLSEVRLGEKVHIHVRLLQRNAKRIHFMYFMVNQNKGVLSATLESVASHADLKLRRTSPYPPEISVNLDAMIADHSQLGWDAPINGHMSV
jgi:acyl-CoA thioester hydrolase